MTDEEKRAKNAAAAKRWRDEHPGYDKRTAEDRRDWKRAYNAAHRKELNAAHRAYVAAHPELREYVKAKAKAWREAHPERAAELSKEWRSANPERVRKRQTAWRKANLEKVHESQRDWKKANPDKAHRQERDGRYRWLYGIGIADYERMLATQDGRCAICRTDTPGAGRKHFTVDHCHSTERVRGLLCPACNSGIGQLKDSIPLLEAAISYLKSHQVVGPPT